MLIQPVILSGGSGTRLWPLSREKYPKQLLPLIGEDSLLQATVRRVEGIVGLNLAPPMVVCGEEYRFVIAEQLRLLGKSGTIVLEPFGRNTAPALTLAALAANETGADPVLLVMPADHVITNVPAFQKVVSHGAALATKGAVVTFGIQPEAPETGYGYIHSGAAYPEDFGEAHGGSRLIARFVEKPDLATAQTYLDAGTYLWNSGLFMMRASVWLSVMQVCRPDILKACQTAWIRVQPTVNLRGLTRRFLPAARRTRSTTRSWNALLQEQTMAYYRPALSFRWRLAGRMWAPGTLYGKYCQKTVRATSPKAMCCCRTAATPWPFQKAGSSPAWV